ncbi:MAG: CPBP family intramembrane metalloprotease [Puniceicoccales bacterium]|nr:CPBP family intramembrane metalloprotease [Puniceicoccales bacterium]
MDFPGHDDGERWHTWCPLLAFSAIFFGATLCAAILTPPVHRVLCSLAPGSAVAAHALAKPLAKLVDRLRWPFLAIGLVWLLKKENGRPWLRFPKNQGCWKFFLLGSLLAVTVCCWQMVHANWHGRPIGLAVLLAFAAAPLVAFLEEIVFRGLLLHSAERAMGRTMGAVICSLFFACVHFNIPSGAPPMATMASVSIFSGLVAGWDLLTAVFFTFQPIPFLSLFLLGLVLCRWTRRFGSLLPAIGFHWSIALAALLFRRLVVGCPAPINSPLCPILLCIVLICDSHGHHRSTKHP